MCSRREKLLDVDVNDVKEVAHKYLSSPPKEKTAVAVLGEEKDWVKKEGWAIRSLGLSEEATSAPAECSSSSSG